MGLNTLKYKKILLISIFLIISCSAHSFRKLDRTTIPDLSQEHTDSFEFGLWFRNHMMLLEEPPPILINGKGELSIFGMGVYVSLMYKEWLLLGKPEVTTIYYDPKEDK